MYCIYHCVVLLVRPLIRAMICLVYSYRSTSPSYSATQHSEWSCWPRRSLNLATHVSTFTLKWTNSIAIVCSTTSGRDLVAIWSALVCIRSSRQFLLLSDVHLYQCHLLLIHCHCMLCWCHWWHNWLSSAADIVCQLLWLWRWSPSNALRGWNVVWLFMRYIVVIAVC